MHEIRQRSLLFAVIFYLVQMCESYNRQLLVLDLDCLGNRENLIDKQEIPLVRSRY